MRVTANTYLFHRFGEMVFKANDLCEKGCG